MQTNLENARSATAAVNGESALHDLFTLTDEQILEIEPEAQDVSVREAQPARGEGLNSDPLELNDDGQEASDTREEAGMPPGKDAAQVNGTGDRASAGAEPPRWLADRMADPQTCGEARDLWNEMQAARAERAAYREVFAKPEEARAAAERARALDGIDQAYFAGDAGARSRLAASLLREDPAAFREMVFAGLRALEEVGSGLSELRMARALAPENAAASTVADTRQRQTAASHDDPRITAYAAFERAANEDLERSVGRAIEQALDQALPNNGRGESNTLKSRLAATIQQEVESGLKADQQLGKQVAQVLSGKRLDNETRAQVVRLIGERAEQLVPGAAKRMLNDWTRATLTAHRGQGKREEAPVAGTEVAAASGEPTPRSGSKQGAEARPGTRKGIDYRKLSDEQILDL
jgi:hypothetical protein